MWHKPKKSALTCVVLLAVCVVDSSQALAQSKPAGAAKSPLCTRDNALDMIKQQIDLTKTVSDPLKRITILLRAADLLWPYQQDRARAVFTEAFELAVEKEKETDQKGPRSIILRLRVADQRYVVIRAVAKRDPALAREFTRQMLKQDTEDTQASSARDSFDADLTAEKLLYSAYQLISTDTNAAIDLARAGFNYPASSMLTRFLYQLAGVNQQAADQFYTQALEVYGDRPMREFLYLQAYPFGLTKSINTPVFAFNYPVPGNFVMNQSLQRQYVRVALRRAQQAIEAPFDERDTYRNTSATSVPGPVSLLQSLIELEPHVRKSLPDLLGPVTQAREKILVSLSPENQKLLVQPGREVSVRPETTFDEEIESAQKAANVIERDNRLANAVLNEASDNQSLASVIETIDKISEASVRAHLLDLVYFRRARTAIGKKQFEEAERLAAKVEAHEPRAYLQIEIAKGLLNNTDTQTHGREVLDSAITAANKAGVTLFVARTLLTASNLYTRIDFSRSLSLLADAINCINRIGAPDFVADDQAQEKLVPRGPGRGHYTFHYYMPGLDPESAFREMGKLDFDTSLSQVSALTDKLQRALSTLALADVCLQEVQQAPKPKPKKTARP